MGFDHFNVKAFIEIAPCSFQELERDIDPHAHVGRKHGCVLLCKAANQGKPLRIETRRANYRLNAALRALLKISQRGFGSCEVDQHVGRLQRKGGVVGDFYAGLPAHKFGCVFAKHGAGADIESTCELGMRISEHCFDQHLAHAPRGA